MTPKQRVLTAIAHREPDRVPVDYKANPGIDARLKQHFGLRPDDWEGLFRALGVDFRRIGAPYKGPKLHADLPGRQVDDWGIRRRWIEHETGGYCFAPTHSLQDNSPTDNVVAMYEAARTVGAYR